MTLLERWFKLKSSDDQRRGKRQQWPPLVAHYWTGAAPSAIRVRSISSSGMCLMTDEGWYPGTVLKITLQRTDEPDESAEQSIVVLSRVIRRDADGVGLEFILAKSPASQSEQSQQDTVADRKSMDRYVERLFEEESRMFMEIN